tara:strand:+ start:1173 stop:2258 length:1086 start_codon:yes stop_codon:yes gene_type:complete
MMTMATALEASWAMIDEIAGPDSIDAAKARALMVGYDARWKDAGYATISTEEEFRLPIVNPASGRSSQLFQQGGKFDGIIERDGRHFLLEHKTAGEEIRDRSSPYWRRLAIDSQVSMYVLANWQAERKLDGTIYDVIRKPATNPVNLAPGKMKAKAVTLEQSFGTIREMKEFGSYYGVKQDERVIWDVLEQLDRGSKPRESAFMYQCRLISVIGSDLNKYYQRQMVPRLDHEILEFANELWQVAKDINEARKHQRWYRNSDACMSWNTPCEYLGICSDHDSVDSEKWDRADSVHPELGLEDRGADLITNSRVKCFQTCRRKHFYRYEIGLKKRDQEDRHALWFGSLMHEALRTWFDCFRKE